MDVRKLEKGVAVSTSSRHALFPAERNANAAEATSTTRLSRTKEVSSRYKSPTPHSRRAMSPNISRTVSASSQLAPKRAVSAERRRPSTPPSPAFTPVRDSSMDVQLAASRRLNIGSRLPESLWPSTMRSLSVSFQSDSISIPVGKKEKPPPVNNVSDRTLRPSSNGGHKQAESPGKSRKTTPERKRSPLKGNNIQGQSENAKPVDGLHSRLIDQHRWPSRIGGKVSSNSLNRSLDLTGKTVKAPATSTGVGLSSPRRNPIPNSASKLLQKSSSDAARLLSEELNRTGNKANPDDDIFSLTTDLEKLATSLSDRISLATPAARSSSFSSFGSRPASPSRNLVSRGVSPARSRPSTPPPRGVSPSRVRASSGSTQSSSSSVLSFIVDLKKGKKRASHIEEAHYLRLLYNRCLQWRFANARAEAVLFIQKVMAWKSLYNAWEATSVLWEAVAMKRINLLQLNLEFKLNAVLNDQMIFLDNWASLEKNHLDSLSGAVEDLQANTIRLPVTGDAKADIESLRPAIRSAVDVMQAIASSMCSSPFKVESTNALVSELAIMVAQERTMLDDCKVLIDSAAAMQVEEYSNRTHLIQINNISKKQCL